EAGRQARELRFCQALPRRSGGDRRRARSQCERQRSGRRPLSAMGNLIRCLAVATLLPLSAIAQTYPTKPVRLMVPFPPGGATDIVGRLVAAQMQVVWGQPVVVENKPGAGTVVGTDYVAKAAPDGHT